MKPKITDFVNCDHIIFELSCGEFSSIWFCIMYFDV